MRFVFAQPPLVTHFLHSWRLALRGCEHDSFQGSLILTAEHSAIWFFRENTCAHEFRAALHMGGHRLGREKRSSVAGGLFVSRNVRSEIIMEGYSVYKAYGINTMKECNEISL